MGVFRIRQLPASVNASVFDWLRAHGKAVRPELSRAERDQLQVFQHLLDKALLSVLGLWRAPACAWTKCSASAGGHMHATQI